MAHKIKTTVTFDLQQYDDLTTLAMADRTNQTTYIRRLVDQARQPLVAERLRKQIKEARTAHLPLVESPLAQSPPQQVISPTAARPSAVGPVDDDQTPPPYLRLLPGDIYDAEYERRYGHKNPEHPNFVPRVDQPRCACGRYAMDEVFEAGKLVGYCYDCHPRVRAAALTRE